MARSALLAALAACCAVIAFGVGASAFGIIDSSGTTSSDGGETRPVNSGGPSEASDIASSDDSSDSDGYCVSCWGGVRSLVDGWIPAANPLLLLGVTAIVVISLGIAGLRSNSDRTSPPDEEPLRSTTIEDRSTDETSSEIAISGASEMNRVYRAWQAMIERLDVERPATTTSREYAHAAIAAGLDGDAVTQLTELFERVRYGDANPTDDREQQALDALDALKASDDSENSSGGEN